MGIYVRNKIWWVKYKATNGKWQYESSKSTKRYDAKRLYDLRAGEAAKGVPVTSQVGRMRFTEGRDDLIAYHKANGRETKKLEGRIKKHLTPYFGHLKMTDITTATANAYIGHRRKSGCKPATINRELMWLKHMFTLALDAGKLMVKPKIAMLKEHNVRTGFFEDHEYEAVLEQLPKELQPVITLAYWTGWRVNSELLRLKWTQVDRKNCLLRLEPGTTKNREGRTFPYRHVAELVAVIEAQWAIRQLHANRGKLIPWVFHRKGDRIVSLIKAFKAACVKAGCPGRIPHDLRRTAVRNLERAGVSRSVAMKLTGHKTESVYRRYAIASEADLNEGVSKLAVPRQAATVATS